jgi:hypothetical protein
VAGQVVQNSSSGGTSVATARGSSTLLSADSLVELVTDVRESWRLGDEAGVRLALRRLSQQADDLARVWPFPFDTRADRRPRIAAE